MEKKDDFSVLRMVITAALFLLVLLCILLVRSPVIFASNQSQNGSISLQTVKIQKIHYQHSYTYLRQFIGQVEAKQRSQLGFEIAGMLKALPFDEGDKVKAGDTLAKLDTARLNATKKQAEANLLVAKANANLAATTYKRVSTAQKSNAVTIQEKDEAREARDVTKAAVNLAKAQLETILVDIAKANLISPYDGVIIKRMADLGTVLAIGQPIFEIQQDGNFFLRVGVTSEIANRLNLGDKQKIHVNGKDHQAIVKAVLPVRGQARTIEIILELEQTQVQLRSGDMVQLPMSFTVNKSGFWIPITALIEGRRGLWSLYVLNHESGKVERRSVEILQIDNTQAFVFGAVNDGESVVTEGASKLVPNQQVKVVSDEK